MNPKKLPYSVKEFTESFPTNCSVTDDCLEGDVRIRDGTHPSNGRVEVCKNGIWGSVCFSGWSDNEAAVVCRHLGHDSNGTANLSYTRIYTYFLPSRFKEYKCILCWVSHADVMEMKQVLSLAKEVSIMILTVSFAAVPE